MFRMGVSEADRHRVAPRWLYWAAAVMSPAVIPLGVLLCLAISQVLGHEPVVHRSADAGRTRRR